MSSVIAKNELLAAKRRADLIIWQDGGTALAPRGTDFMALGILYIKSGTTYATGLGTCTNNRRPLTFTPFTFTADSTTDKLTHTAHGLETGDGAVSASNAGGALPAPLAAGTVYYVIKVDADNFYLATSLANAYAGTRIDITTNGTGTQTLSPGASGPPTTACTRGIDGRFTYEFTQAETNVDASELAVLVEGTGYTLIAGGGTYTSINVAPTLQGVETIAEGSSTIADLIRGIWSVVTGKSGDYTTGTYTFKDPATGTKTRVTVTANATGRTAVTVGDLT